MNPDQNIENPLSVLQSNEHTLFEIRRHPIGIIGLYIMSGLLLIFLALLLFVLMPRFLDDFSGSQTMKVIAMGYTLVAILTGGFLLIANRVYWGNRWVLTTDSITQMTQLTLFHNQSSQLSLGNLEDITAEQSGIFAHMFNYGTLRVQTAGEHSKFLFIYCPDPNKYAQQVISARERYEQHLNGQDAAPTPTTPPVQK